MSRLAYARILLSSVVGVMVPHCSDTHTHLCVSFVADSMEEEKGPGTLIPYKELILHGENPLIFLTLSSPIRRLSRQTSLHLRCVTVVSLGGSSVTRIT